MFPQKVLLNDEDEDDEDDDNEDDDERRDGRVQNSKSIRTRQPAAIGQMAFYAKCSKGKIVLMGLFLIVETVVMSLHF